MKITELTMYGKELKLKEPNRLSRGRVFEMFQSTFLKVDTDAGVTGWSEVCPWGSNYLPAFPGGVRAAIAEIAPHLVGRDPRHPEAITRLMDSVLSGHIYAKAAVDYALWDIKGKALGLPIYELLGGEPGHGGAPLMAAHIVDTPEKMIERLQYWRSLGYLRHSIKLGSSVREDIARIRALAPLRRDEEEFIFDANGGWSSWEAVRVLNAAADLEFWVEQPCATYEQCLSVRGKVRQAMSLDECIVDVRDLVRALTDRTIDVLNMKLARVGGVTRALLLRDLCMAYDIPILVMCMAGTVINDTVVAHFAQSVPKERLLGTWSCQEMVTFDPAPGQGARNVGGKLLAPDLPGLGVEPDVSLLGSPLACFK